MLAVALLCAALMLVVPTEGWNVGGENIRFKTWQSLWATDTTLQKIDVDQYLASLDSLQKDSAVVDTLAHLTILRKQGITSLQFRDENSRPMFSFFEALHRAKDDQVKLHVIHYGDSQIENDRITAYLRQKWQGDFGGNGPGLISPVPIAEVPSVKLSRSDNWKRYTSYGFDEAKCKHNKYGIMASFGRFTAYGAVGDSAQAWLEVRPSNMAQPACRNYTRVSVLMGNFESDVTLRVFLLDSLIRSQKFTAGSAPVKYDVDLGFTPSQMRFSFTAQSSPDVYAMLLEGNGGVQVDNVAMRGCDGNIFRRIAADEIRFVEPSLNAELILLQYGGNALPYIDSDGRAENYGKFFRSQIQYLKSWFPNASFLVIGPSDMSTTVNGEYQTWPYLEKVRDELRAAAFAEDCGFWDMYEVMGGKNSMVSWVTHDPPYAGPDYTHFTPLGAKKMAEFLYNAILDDYNAWRVAVEARDATPQQ